MLNILKSGGRLSLAEGGRLPASSKCCCENSAGCFCSFICAYQLKATTTSGLSVRSGPAPCDTFSPPQTVDTGFQFSPPHAEDSWLEDGSQAAVSGTSSALWGRVSHYARGGAGVTGSIPPRLVLLTIGASITIDFICETVQTDEGYVSQNRAFVNLFVRVVTEAPLNFFERDDQIYTMHKTGVFVLPSSCVEALQKVCPGSQDGTALLIDAPLTISVNSQTTSLGSYSSVEESVSGTTTYGDRAKEIGEYIRDNIDAKFDLSVRPSCPAAECDCTASLAGTTWNFMGEEFQYGTEYDNWSEDGFQRWYFSGNGAAYYESYDPSGEVDSSGHGTRLLSRKRVDIYCDYVNGEPTWVVILRALCAGYDPDGVQTHHAEDTWIGQLFCYSACEDEFRSAGAPIPVGGPKLVSFIGRENLGLQECSPGGQPFITVSQTGAC